MWWQRLRHGVRVPEHDEHNQSNIMDFSSNSCRSIHLNNNGHTMANLLKLFSLVTCFCCYAVIGCVMHGLTCLMGDVNFPEEVLTQGTRNSHDWTSCFCSDWRSCVCFEDIPITFSFLLIPTFPRTWPRQLVSFLLLRCLLVDDFFLKRFCLQFDVYLFYSVEAMCSVAFTTSFLFLYSRPVDENSFSLFILLCNIS